MTLHVHRHNPRRKHRLARPSRPPVKPDYRVKPEAAGAAHYDTWPEPTARPNPYEWPEPFDLGHALTAIDRQGVDTERVAAILGVTTDDIVDWIQGNMPPADKLAVYGAKLAQIFADAQAWQDSQPNPVTLDAYIRQRECERRPTCSSNCGNVA